MSTSPSIFDQYRQSVAALPPPPTPNLAGMAGPTSPGGVPSNLNIPMPATPNVQRIPTQLENDQSKYQQVKMAGPGEEQLYHKITGSEFGQNHPILGKVLGGLAAGVTGAADIGLGTLGGGIGRLAEEQIPGTLLNHQVQLNRAGKDITTDEANAGKEAQTASENATAAETGARQKQTEEMTAEMPGKTQSEEGLQKATTENLQSETQHRGEATTPELGTYRSLVQMGMSPSEALQEIEKDKQLALKPAEIPPEQQYLTEYAKTHPDSTVAQAEHQYMLDTQRPPQVAPVNMFLPGQQPGTETLTTVRPGQTVAAGAQTASGVNSMNTPTTNQRTAAGRAETVIAMAPEVLSRIDAVAPKIGPIAGRWNDFMQGKVGSDDPDFAALRSDLLMMSSAVALAHAQGRLPENLREEFDKAINAPKQTPQNLKATIQTMIPWLQQVQSQGGRQGAQTAAPQRPSGVPANYQWNPQGNGGKGSWRAPQ